MIITSLILNWLNFCSSFALFLASLVFDHFFILSFDAFFVYYFINFIYSLTGSTSSLIIFLIRFIYESGKTVRFYPATWRPTIFTFDPLCLLDLFEALELLYMDWDLDPQLLLDFLERFSIRLRWEKSTVTFVRFLLWRSYNLVLKGF